VIEVHPHLKARMKERGVILEEIETTIENGYSCKDAKPGTYCKVYIFPYNKDWSGKIFKEKEVTGYYKYIDDDINVLTVKTRYGNFSKGVKKSEV